MNKKLISIALFLALGDVLAADCFINKEKNALIDFGESKVAISCVDDHKIEISAKFKNNVVWAEVFIGDTPYFEGG
jgi:hypothetical protein